MKTVIYAKGIYKGKKLLVRVIDGVTYINGQKDDCFDYLIHEQFPIGGTYYAMATSMTNIANTLAYYFFDSKPQIETSGEFEEIPYEDGKIY